MKLLSQSIIALVAISAAGFGCNSSDNNSNPGGGTPVQKTQGPAWQLVYQADAGSNDKTQVVGAYGFTINADGSYMAGPGPNGETLKGNLNSNEFAALQTALQPVISGQALSQAQTCGASQVVSNNDTLTFIQQTSSATFLTKAMNGTVCANGLDTQTAEDLHDLVLADATNYYSLPFPSACLDAANSVQALYAGLTTCSQDSDCAYVDQQFNLIAPTAADTVYIDSCSVVPALPAANANAFQGAQASLQTALANVQSTCGANIVRSGCTATISFNSSQAPAVCVQNTCQVNPSLTY